MIIIMTVTNVITIDFVAAAVGILVVLALMVFTYV